MKMLTSTNIRTKHKSSLLMYELLEDYLLKLFSSLSEVRAIAEINHSFGYYTSVECSTAVPQTPKPKSGAKMGHKKSLQGS